MKDLCKENGDAQSMQEKVTHSSKRKIIFGKKGTMLSLTQSLSHCPESAVSNIQFV